MKKDTIIDYFLAIIVLLPMPIIAFFAINSVIPLKPEIYVITAFTGFYTICIMTTIKLFLINRSWKTIIYSAIVMLIFPPIAFYSYDFLTPIQLTNETFAGAGFGAIFGLCVAVGFELMLPKRFKKLMKKKS